ncbi:MAG TPA: GAF domain-containing protein [Polyangiales bacterium]|nr:GAF domain-containing protein [Polyangiales bacterium]
MRFRWLEVVVITAAAPVIGSLVAPSDAYLLKAPFPWLVLAPLLVALQHGMWGGLASAVLLSAGALWYVMALGSVGVTTLASWSIGNVLVAIIAGQLRDSARARSQSLEQRGEELQDRLERSERTRHLIQLSHAKLAERVAASRSSLAGAIDGAQRRMADARSMHELGQALLEVLAAQGNLHAASLYIAGREPNQLVPQPVATFGNSGPSSAHHPLVERAFESGKLAAIVDTGDRSLRDRSVLVAVPLITSARRIVGVVAVHQLPFMAFQAEHLQQVFVLAGHLTDMLFDRWAQLHAQPREASAVVVRAAPESVHEHEQVHEHHSTQRTWRGMPAVRPELEAAEEVTAPVFAQPSSTVEAEPVAVPELVATPIVVREFSPVPEAKQSTLRQFAAVTATQSEPEVRVEEQRTRFTVPPITLPPKRSGAARVTTPAPVAEPAIAEPAPASTIDAQSTSTAQLAEAATEPSVERAETVAAANEEPATVDASQPTSAEDPVSATQPIETKPRRSTPPPDPNRIAAVIRKAVRAPKKVKGTPIGAIKPVSAGGAQLRERVRAIAQARSGSSR